MADFLPSPSALPFDKAVATVDDDYDNESFLAVVRRDESYRADFSQAIQERLGAVFDSPPTFSLPSPAVTSNMHDCKRVAKVTSPTPVTPMSEHSGHEHAAKKELTHQFIAPVTPMSERSGHEHAAKKEPTHQFISPVTPMSDRSGHEHAAKKETTHQFIFNCQSQQNNDFGKHGFSGSGGRSHTHHVMNQAIENSQRRNEICTSLFYPITADKMSNQVCWLSNSIDGPYPGNWNVLASVRFSLRMTPQVFSMCSMCI
jgi:hypothetical protein